jgi:hypothetical protein
VARSGRPLNPDLTCSVALLHRARCRAVAAHRHPRPRLQPARLRAGQKHVHLDPVRRRRLRLRDAAPRRPLLKVLTPVDHEALAGVTSAILATHPNPNDRLYVVNSGPWANLTTGLAPPSAYFHRFHLLCDFPGAGLPKLKEDMDALPRYVVINARAMSARCELPSHWAVVNAVLGASYRLAATATGSTDAYKVYERR